jgi:hypothetical protein
MDKDKSTILKGFNNHFFEFVEDIITTFPDNQDLKTSKTSFEYFRKANPTCIIKAWYIFVYNVYREKIEADDITFFFEKDYSGDIDHLANKNDIMRIINTIREPVQQMSPENKVITMKYLKNLSILCARYHTIAK